MIYQTRKEKKIPQPRPETHPRRNIKVSSTESRLSIIHTQGRGCMFSAVTTFGICIFALERAYSWIPSSWMWLYLLGWLGSFIIFLVALNLTIHRTEFTIEANLFLVDEGPLIGPAQLFNAAEIEHLYIKHKRDDEQSDDVSTFHLLAIKTDGRHSLVWGDGDYKVVRYIELEIKKHLNIPDTPVKGEYLPKNDAIS